ncbi:MAG: DUF4249 domain-containing protein [Bacteroidota bacterium]|nr:DUF4249 domain-containing protein [Bacteroidota bacterium]
MKNKILYILIGTTLLFSSCEDVIKVDLPKDQQSNLVVDAYIYSDSVAKVTLTMSLPYFDTMANPKVKADLVTITDNINIDTLVENPVASGIYVGKNMKGVVGNTYTLKIKYNNTEYVATDKLNRTTQFDSLYFIDFPFGRPGNPYNKFSNINHTDPAGLGDNYIAYFWRNDTAFNTLNDLNFTTDQFIDGNQAKDVYIGRPVKKGDKVRVEVHSLSANAYNYYFQMINNAVRQQSLFAPPPAPYKGNISGNALGFFKASAVVAKEAVVN